MRRADTVTSLFSFEPDPQANKKQQAGIRELWRQRGVDYGKLKSGLGQPPNTLEGAYYRQQIKVHGPGIETQKWVLENDAIQARKGKTMTVREHLWKHARLRASGAFGKAK